jgi:hypothetical protein
MSEDENNIYQHVFMGNLRKHDRNDLRGFIEHSRGIGRWFITLEPGEVAERVLFSFVALYYQVCSFYNFHFSYFTLLSSTTGFT